MKFEVAIGDLPKSPRNTVVVGDVFPARGGVGGGSGHMYVVTHIRSVNDVCICLTIDPSGEVVGCTKYGYHYLAGIRPIGFVDGLTDLQFTVVDHPDNL